MFGSDYKNFIKKLILILFPSLSALAQLPTIGLVGYYPFKGNANDLSGNVLNGTVVGATLTADRFGNANSAYSFNGISDYIYLPPGTFTVMNSYSYSFWMKPTASPVSAGTFPFCMGAAGGSNCQAVTYQNATTLFGSGYNTGIPVQSAVQSTPMAPNQWIHVVVTRDNSAIKMYVNGALLAANSTSLTGSNAIYGPGAASVVIGARSNFAAGSFFAGLMDELRIYNTVLNQNEVSNLYSEVCFQNIPLSVSPVTLCAGQTVSLTASGIGSYTANWYTSSSSTLGSASGNTFTFMPWLMNPVQNIYTFYVDAGLCGAYPRSVVNVTVNPLPVLNVTNSGPVCPGLPVLFTATGASTFTWNTGFVGAVLSVTPGQSTSYTVTGTSSTGCTNTMSSQVLILPQPSISISTSPSYSLCAGQTVTLYLSGAYSYSWSFGGTSFIMYVTPTTSTTYSVVGTSANSCTSTASIYLLVHPLPTLQVSMSNTTICSSQSATLLAGGAFSYSWSSNPISFSLSPQIVVSPSVSTTYTLTGTDFFGCKNTSTLQVVVAECLGLNPAKMNALEFTIEPNPNSGTFLIRYPENGYENVSIKLMDMQGKEILQFLPELNSNEFLVTANELDDGLYFCTVLCGTQVLYSKKIVIIH